jgi:site-specific DNA-methyltransferase (adenine-specific)
MTPSALVICSDCLAGLRDLPDNSIDAVVTDPPSGIAFMGADWDKDKGGRDAWIDWLAEIMREVWRVTKPGGHALVWALPRTQHWTATAIENAGWEVRDVLMHVFGSGFPKSLDVSKKIDEMAGHKRDLPKHSAWSCAPGTSTNVCDRCGKSKGGQAGNCQCDKNGQPLTDEAKQWAGWGTALKPSHEAWILARKPLAGTVAATVLEHGTGALNIDGCRVGTDENTAGRWPPHLLLTHAADCGETCADGCPVAEMDAQSGISSDTAHPRGRGIGYGSTANSKRGVVGYGDTGGASRFFPIFRYSAKPSTAEKSAGLGHRTPATGGEATGRKDGSAGLDNPRAGAGRNGGALNIHPTVKPRGLMEWLVKLITPPGGVVLDPFTGSGSTGVAAVGLGFDFIGFEMSEEFAGIARDRIGHAVAGVEIETVGIEDYEPKPEATGQGRLF